MSTETEHVETGIEEAFAEIAATRKSTPSNWQPSSEAQQPPPASAGSDRHVSETFTAAESYIHGGWKTFPGKRGGKEPLAGWSWKCRHLALADAPTYFGKDQCNVLVVLGSDSGNLTDVDLDWPEATAAADFIFDDLPSFGRSGKPRSHRLARCKDIKSKKYTLPQSLANHAKVAGQTEHMMCIAEIRGNGGYTVFPGSEHRTGQKVEWTDINTDASSVPDIEADTLLKKMGLLAFIAFCMRFFPAVGTRCDFMMAVAGALARAGHDAEVIQQSVQSIGAFNDDEGDSGSWRVAAESVNNKIDGGEEVTGLPTLIKILGLGEDVLSWCRDLLGTPGNPVDRLVVPKDDHMGRARVYRNTKRPNLYHYRDDYYDHEAGHYTIIGDDTIRAELYSFLDECSKEVLLNKKTTVVPFAPSKVSVSETSEALKALGHVVPTVEQPHWLDRRTGPNPADLICFPNGILNINSNQFSPPDPILFTPHGVGFDYDPNAAAPTEWLHFLDQVFNGEKDQIGSLQEMFGYCLSSDVSQEKVFMLLGDKRSGKDTMRRALQSLLSPTAICGPTLDSMGTNFGMSQLIGKQLAVVGDMRLGSKCDKDLLAEHVLKLSGRGLFTIDRKNKSHWTGNLPCKLILISNEMPKLKDASGALASRMIVYRTRTSFYGREDRTLFEDKIKPELPAILLWALDGLLRMRQRGPIAEPTCSKAMREELAREGSPIMAFVEECLTLDPAAAVDKNVMYSTYLDFAHHSGLPPTSKSWFYRDLDTATASKVKEQRVRKGGGDVHNILGARISSPPPKRPAKNEPIIVYATAPAAAHTAEDVGSPSEDDVALDDMVADLAKRAGRAARRRSC
jgi:P4 family phage/plasmid primase-like protien